MTSDVSGRRSMTRADSLDELGDFGIGRSTSPQKVGDELGIRQIENPLEARQIGGVERCERYLRERLENSIELVHPAPTAPAQPRELHARRFRASLCAHRRSEPALGDHLLDLGDRLAGVQIFRTRLSAVQYRVAAIETERVL